MALRHVRQYPDPVLRRVCDDITEFDAELTALVERMWNIMGEAYGVGLAAPQLGLVLNVFTYRIGDDNEPGVLINPKITASGDETDTEDEGCLSLGDLRVPVERPTAVTITAQDLAGEDVKMDVEDFTARVMQHEIDHLNGVLMFDRAANDEARAAAMSYLRPRP